jgi:hypothetical protein
MNRLHLELVCRADSADFAARARSWLTDARAEFSPQLSRRLPDAPVLRRQQAHKPAVPAAPRADTPAHQYRCPAGACYPRDAA